LLPVREYSTPLLAPAPTVVPMLVMKVPTMVAPL
jgi:hypothetical protein